MSPTVSCAFRQGVAPDEIVFKKLNDFKAPGKHPEYAKIEWEVRLCNHNDSA